MGGFAFQVEITNWGDRGVEISLEWGGSGGGNSWGLS